MKQGKNSGGKTGDHQEIMMHLRRFVAERMMPAERHLFPECSAEDPIMAEAINFLPVEYVLGSLRCLY